MKSLQIIISCLLVLCAIFHTPAAAAPAKREIPAFIDANRRNKDFFFNSAKYDPEAKVYYLCYIHTPYSKSAFDEATRYLIPVYKKIFNRSAELILMFKYSDSDQEEYERYKRNSFRINLPAECKHLSLRCPIVNVFHNEVRKALLKAGASSHYSSPSYPNLRAVNADGTPLAYFYLEDDSIAMRDANLKTKRYIKESGFNTEEWMGTAILTSYKELVAKVEAEEAPAEAKAETEPKVEKKSKKKESKKKASSPQRWKKLDI